MKPAFDLERIQRLRAWDDDHVWHPFTPMQSYWAEAPPIIDSAEGFELVDVEGNRYLDGFSSLWCNVHGHRVPRIDQAVRDQLDRVAHSTLLGHACTPSIELARRLVALAPKGLTKVFYSDSGASAVEVALKLAFQYHRQKPGGPEPRDLFVGLGDAYHGDTVGAVSVGGIDLFHGVYAPLLFRTLRAPSPVVGWRPDGESRESRLALRLDALRRVLTENAERIAALVVEPLVQGAAGVLVHPPGFLRQVRDWTRELGILLIADEVAVGFGRTGAMFACEHEDVSPDLLCLGKGLTGGYLPVAATLATDEIFDAFLGRPADARTFFHGHTYTGNALGCAAALASLELFEENRVVENVRRNEQVLERRLTEIADFDHVAEVRCKGVMVGIELAADREKGISYPPEQRRGHAVTLAARARGILIRPLGDVVVLMPAPAMPEALVHRLCDAVAESIRDATEREPERWTRAAARLA